jgi:hypothetical protein
MTEGQVIALLGSLAGLAIAALSVWRFVEARINSAAKDALDKAGMSAALATLTQTMLAEHKLHVAETYVTKAGLREFRDEVMGGIKEIKGSVSTISDRIDQMILADRKEH